MDYTIYMLLVSHTNISYIVANCISVLAGIVTSFTLNRKYNFKVKEKTIKRFTIFLTVGICGMACSNLILYVCIDIIGVHELLSKLLSIVFVVLGQFIVNKYITFNQRKI